MEKAVHCQGNNSKLSRARWKTWCCLRWGRDLQQRKKEQQVRKAGYIFFEILGASRALRSHAIDKEVDAHGASKRPCLYIFCFAAATAVLLLGSGAFLYTRTKSPELIRARSPVHDSKSGFPAN